jgi:hypothetical protein
MAVGGPLVVLCSTACPNLRLDASAGYTDDPAAFHDQSFLHDPLVFRPCMSNLAYIVFQFSY